MTKEIPDANFKHIPDANFKHIYPNTHINIYTIHIYMKEKMY